VRRTVQRSHCQTRQPAQGVDIIELVEKAIKRRS
jgi:hypothetical protein